ncbi:MAG TPA: DNA polymerase III subunit beta [Acidimicrobiales bacterium]|nr:DNA polymerase III subunit beta [Acidimicrobiales bacterium]
MRFRCERDTLAEALSTAGRAVSRTAALQALAGLRLAVEGDQLQVAGCDLDLTIETTTKVSGTSEGVVVAPARLLADIVRSLDPGAVSVESADEELQVTAGRAEFSVRTFNPDDFPRLPPREGQTTAVVAAEFADALRQVVPAAATDDNRPMLTGVLLTSESGQGLRMVATDSYRLAKRELPTTTMLAEGQKVLVPARALAELQRILSSSDSLTVRLGANDAGFEVGSVVLTTRLIEGEFPNYNQLIPQSSPNRLVVPAAALVEAVRRMRLLVREATTPVRIALRSDGIELSVATPDVGQAKEDLDAKYEGSEMVIAFNPAYLVEAVEAAGGDEVVVEMIDALKPAVIRPVEGQDYVHLLMPVRVP